MASISKNSKLSHMNLHCKCLHTAVDSPVFHLFTQLLFVHCFTSTSEPLGNPLSRCFCLRRNTVNIVARSLLTKQALLSLHKRTAPQQLTSHEHNIYSEAHFFYQLQGKHKLVQINIRS